MSLSKIFLKTRNIYRQFLAKKKIELENAIALSAREEDPGIYPAASHIRKGYKYGVPTSPIRFFTVKDQIRIIRKQKFP